VDLRDSVHLAGPPRQAWQSCNPDGMPRYDGVHDR
jgi:hypothetical protein